LSVTYLHVEPGAILPNVEYNAPYRAVLIVDEPTSPEWQAAASDWLVQSGCMYTMAWGINCSSWDDSVDWANIEKFAPQDTPDDGFVVTTWHDKETLEEVFWYCKNCAVHPTINLNHTLLFHIAACEREAQITRLYAAAA